MTDWTDAHELRLHNIAVNAVREARITYGRDDGIWLDTDTRAAQLIAQLLHLMPASDIKPDEEQRPVAPAEAPTENQYLDRIRKAISSLDDGDDLDPPKPRNLDNDLAA